MTKQPFVDIFDAARKGTIADVRYCVEEQGADVNTDNGKCEGTPLHVAAGFNSVDVLEYLISQGADVNAKSMCGCTPLHTAALWNPNVDVVQYLISMGADVNATSKFGDTPLYQAVIALHDGVEVLQYLISQGADVNAKRPLSVANTEERKRILREAMANNQ